MKDKAVFEDEEDGYKIKAPPPMVGYKYEGRVGGVSIYSHPDIAEDAFILLNNKFKVYKT